MRYAFCGVCGLNGEVWSEGNSGTSYWTVAQVIEFTSINEPFILAAFLEWVLWVKAVK